MHTQSAAGVGSYLLAAAIGAFPLAASLPAAEPPSIEEALAIRPRHGDVEYDIPEQKTIKQCKITAIGEGKARGWVVADPAGQVIRQFWDNDGNGFVDQWSYFRAGLEVYRDVDTNGNNKIDQSRWLNLGGMRWGLDANEDGKIDSWKMISAEEVSRIAVRALVAQDASLLAPLLLTKDDLKQLGIKGPLETKLLASVADPGAKLARAVKGSKIIQAKTTWLRFDASPPGVIPADSNKTAADLHVYENVMAIVDFGNPNQPGLVSVGELVRVGDVWKMTTVPTPLEGNTELAAGLVMFHAAGAGPESPTTPTSAPSKEIQELVEKLRKLLENPPAATAAKAAWEKHYIQVEKVLIDLVNESKTDDERAQWTRQLLDTVASAVQSGNYPSGVKRLRELEAQIVKGAPKSPLVAAAIWRRMLAEYADAMHDAKGDKDVMQKVHAKWLEDCEEFVDKHAKAEEAPDAVLQIAMGMEFGGKPDKAKKWYQRIVDDYADSTASAKSAGALQRLELDGKALALSGPALAGSGVVNISQFRGKVVLVVFWDTNSKLFDEDLPPIKALYDQYRAKGFEVIGVNFDAAKDGVEPYLRRNQIKWPQIHEPGGLQDAPLARSFGIISLPTMFLVDADGKVTNRNATVTDVKNALEEAFSKK